jgi:hypothetical protein
MGADGGVSLQTVLYSCKSIPFTFQGTPIQLDRSATGEYAKYVFTSDFFLAGPSRAMRK